MGSIGATTSNFIISRNSEGQEIQIPRQTYEDRLDRLQQTRQNIVNAGSINPDELRRIDNQINDLKKALRTGRRK